jgi:hypothetical protein
MMYSELTLQTVDHFEMSAVEGGFGLDLESAVEVVKMVWTVLTTTTTTTTTINGNNNTVINIHH